MQRKRRPSYLSVIVLKLTQLLLCVHLLAKHVSATSGRPYGGTLLQQALREVVGPVIQNHIRNSASSISKPEIEAAREKEKTLWEKTLSETAEMPVSISSNYKSSMQRRCTNFLACEHHIPVVEIHNAIFHAGTLYLNEPDDSTLDAIRNLNLVFASRKNHLPASLASGHEAGSEWLPGPRIVVYSATNKEYAIPAGFEGIGRQAAPTHCGTVWDTSAFFLLPWEVTNTFHVVNDNVLSVLASVVLQYLTDVTHGHDHAPARPKHHTLFMFKPRGKPTLLMQLLAVLFGGDVREARELLSPESHMSRSSSYSNSNSNSNSDSNSNSNSNTSNFVTAHCVRRVAWGSASKPFYVDGLGQLRRVLFTVLRRVLSLKFGESLASSANLEINAIHQEVSSQAQAVQARSEQMQRRRGNLHVVIVTRSFDGPKQAARAIQETSELALVDAFARSPEVAGVTRCCQFSKYKTVESLAAVFANADICVGVHGAGLSNCLLGPPGMIVLEMQAKRFSYFGFDSFMKIAHMSTGTYMGCIATTLGAQGMVFSADEVTDIISTALRLATAPSTVLPSVVPSGGLVHFTAPEGTSFILVPSPHAQWLPLLTPADILGPLGLYTKTPFAASEAPPLVPYYSTREHVTQLKYADQCKLLPYYSFRKYTTDLIKAPAPVLCDQAKIRRKPSSSSLTAPFSALAKPYLAPNVQ